MYYLQCDYRCVLSHLAQSCFLSGNIIVWLQLMLVSQQLHVTKCVYLATACPVHRQYFCPSRNQLYPQNRLIIFFYEHRYILLHWMYFCIFPINTVYFIELLRFSHIQYLCSPNSCHILKHSSSSYFSSYPLPLSFIIHSLSYDNSSLTRFPCLCLLSRSNILPQYDHICPLKNLSWEVKLIKLYVVKEILVKQWIC